MAKLLTDISYDSCGSTMWTASPAASHAITLFRLTSTGGWSALPCLRVARSTTPHGSLMSGRRSSTPYPSNISSMTLNPLSPGGAGVAEGVKQRSSRLKRIDADRRRAACESTRRVT